MHTVARLTASLLARKGDATPTVAIGVRSQLGHALRRQAGLSALADERREELIREVIPMARAAVEAGEQASPARARRPRRADGRVALTLRLDPERHRRLRIAAARAGKSRQALLVEVLEAHLARTCADCSCVTGTCERTEDSEGKGV